MERPAWLKAKIEALDELCADYPDTIPIEVAAKFFKIDPNQIRVWAMKNPDNPFAIGIGGEKGRYGYTRILTIPFYLWCTKQ